MDNSLNSKNKVLLHICCAPCSASAVKILQNIYDISFYWYNPNIYDDEEYKKRKESAVRYAKELGIPFCENPDFLYNYKDWKDKSYEQCSLCYTFRLEKTVKFAKDNGFDFFTTSLLSSPYQKHDLIKQIADSLEYKYGVKFLYCDFRPNFYEGKNSLRQKGIICKSIAHAVNLIGRCIKVRYEKVVYFSSVNVFVSKPFLLYIQ